MVSTIHQQLTIVFHHVLFMLAWLIYLLVTLILGFAAMIIVLGFKYFTTYFINGLLILVWVLHNLVHVSIYYGHVLFWTPFHLTSWNSDMNGGSISINLFGLIDSSIDVHVSIHVASCYMHLMILTLILLLEICLKCHSTHVSINSQYFHFSLAFQFCGPGYFFSCSLHSASSFSLRILKESLYPLLIGKFHCRILWK